MGSFLALKENLFNPFVLIFAAITAVMLQILSNLANDYGDYTKGVDNMQRIGQKREMQSGNITKREMQIGIGLTGILCAIFGCILLFFSLEFVQKVQIAFHFKILHFPLKTFQQINFKRFNH